MAWLVELKITTVALGATSVYWIPLAELLAEAKIAVCLVNPRHVQNVSDRKSDVMDCQWLQYLHSVGLLRGAFRPPAEVRAVRALWRHREALVRHDKPTERTRRQTTHLERRRTACTRCARLPVLT